MDEPEVVYVVLPAGGSAYAYGDTKARVREVLDRLQSKVEERLKTAGFRTPARGNQLPGFESDRHTTIKVEKEVATRSWRGRKTSRMPAQQLVDEIRVALEGIDFPVGCFIVTGTEWARVGDMDKWDREMWLRRGAVEDAHVKHWHETGRMALSKHQTTGRRLP